MILISKIDNVNKFVVDRNNLYYHQNNRIYHNSNLIKDLKSDFFGEFYITNGNLIIQSYLGQFEYNGNKYKGYFNYLDKKNVSYINTESSRINIINDTNEVSIILNKNYFNIENKAIVIDGCTIMSFSFPEVSPIWQFDLSSLGSYKNLTNETCNYEVKHFIGVYDQKLIIQLSNATFLFLNIESGEYIRTLHLNEILELPKPVFYEDAYPAHIEENQLIWLSNQRLLKIDIETFEASVIRDYFTAPKGNQYRFMSNTYKDAKIYFVADYGWQYVTPSHVGVMDANTGDILWHEQLENTGGLPEAPQVSDDKLYVRTNNKVLHIFKLDN